MIPQIAGYAVKERLNADGGHTSVFRAVREATGESVVVKCPPPHAGPDEVVRVRTEFAVLSGLQHPGIVRCVELIDAGGPPVLVLERLPGSTLQDHLHKVGRCDLAQFFGMATRLCGILQVVHASRWIHLDVNPSNVMVDPASGGLWLIDFGISTRVRREQHFAFNPAGLAGTLPFIAPEQTGRTNRSVDYRADLYALGCSLYMMLAGRPPFEGRDPLEVVHQHIARAPVPVDHHRPEIPRSLARIVGRLLAKNAEDRYQSAAGVAADLVRCEQGWRAGVHEDFPLGSADRSALFAVPEALIGREQEVARLLALFDGMVTGRPTLTLVAGYSGVGKSRLVREVQRPLAARSGYFCAGKFDQFQRHVPFAALAQALSDLLGQVLTEPAERVATWRTRMLEALQGNGGLLTPLVPELELLIGAQPAVPELPPSEARHRHAATLRAFFAACGADGRPLVIFLDDLQWIDGATLEWLDDTLGRTDGAPLFLIGAYRDNEVDAAHPLMEAVDRLRGRGASVHTLTLEALGRPLVDRLLAATLHRSVGEVGPLAEVLYERTGGNPFFLHQLLDALHDDGAIRFDAPSAQWTWDTAAAVASEASPNVVDLVVGRLGRLSPRARETLFTAACLGSRFDSRTLTLATGAPEPAVMMAMEEARDGGFLVRIRAEAGHLTWGFLHDRVQQAAMLLVDDPSGARRRRVGWQMIDAGRDDLLFGALQNLNPTREHEADRTRLAALNLEAARRARAANAYGPAREHARLAAELEPTPTFEVAFESAWCAHLAGDPEAAEPAFLRAQALASDDDQKARAFEARVHFYTDLARFPEAYAAGREGAAVFGHAMPASFFPPALVWDFLAVKASLRGIDVRTMVDRPEMTDPRLVIGCRLGAAALKAAYQIQPELCVANAARLVRATLQHGMFDDAPVAWLVLGAIFQGGVLGWHAAGHDWGRLAIDLIDRFDNGKQRAEILFVFGYFASSWSQPMLATEGVFRAAWRAGQQSGDVFHASCACTGITQNLWMRGAPLDEVLAECDRFLPFLAAAQTVENEGTVRVVRQAARSLRGETRALGEMTDDGFDEAVFVEGLASWGSKHFAHFHAVDRLALCVLTEQWEEARRWAAASERFMSASVGMQHAAEHTFYAALAQGAQGSPGPVRKALKAFRAYADRCPENFRHKALILEGELARVESRPQDAAELWDRAAGVAAAQGFRQHEGLAMLLAARMHRGRDNERAASRALREAVGAFRSWGATALAERLGSELPHVEHASSWRTTTGGSRRTTHTTSELTGLDAASLLKAGEALSAEVRLGGLLERMLSVVAENAGAQRVVLLLPDGPVWRIQGERDVEAGSSRVLLGTDAAGDPGIASSVVQYALRTQRPVVVDDLREDDRFRTDPRAEHARAVLCMPLVHKQRTRGLLYLENNLTVGGFTVDRVALLEMLAGPMAVSVENAELYESLEDKVRERTQQLEQRNRLIRQTFGRYLSDDVVDTLLESPDGLALGGERRKVTILMSDLRGFVSASDRNSPEQVVQLLNNYLSRMTRIIFEHRGTIDEFIGDAILVVFGAPFQRADDEARAVHCALRMQQEMEAVNAWNEANGLTRVEMGIGLHTGEVVVGNIGSEARAKYGVVGQTVNLASRIESYSVGGQVLISEATASHVPELVIRGRMTVEPKGVREPMTILEVVGMGGDDPVELAPAPEDILIELTAPVPVEVRALSGKDVMADGLRGHIVALSSTAAEIDGEFRFDALTNLKLDLVAPDGRAIDGLYGKVPMQGPGAGRLRVRFTAVPPAAHDAIALWTAVT